MPPPKKSLLLQEAIAIAEHLLSLSKKSKKGIYWESISMDAQRNTEWISSETIYTGVSGIALFFLELYKHTGKERYLDTTLEAFRWVEDQVEKNPEPSSYALFTGRMSVSFAFLRLYQFDQQTVTLQKALKTARKAEQFLLNTNHIDDLINGTSGTIIGLLHLHAASGEEWILTTIDAFLQRLLERAQIGKKGLYWDRSHQQICGLCGFSHGAAGVGFAFLEAGRYFQNDNLSEVARLAFAYEQYHYQRNWKNWPDFRKGYYSEEDFSKAREQINKREFSYFTEGSDMNAWCHGAAGIGLSRLRAFSSLQDVRYKKDALAALSKTKSTELIQEKKPLRSFTLCHGGGGNADLFLEAFLLWGDKKWKNYAQEVAQEAIQNKKQSGYYYSGFASAEEPEDTSLFMGNAGVGYFLLRCIDPQRTPSILAPALPLDARSKQVSSALSHIHLSSSALKELLLKKFYHRSLAIQQVLDPASLTAFYTSASYEKLFSEFEAFTRQHLAALAKSEKSLLRDAFRVEKAKRRLEQGVESAALVYFQQIVAQEKAKELLEKHSHFPTALPLRLSKDLLVMDQRYNWDSTKPIDTAKAEFQPLLVRMVGGWVTEEPISAFSHLVLKGFKERKNTETLLAELLPLFEPESQEEAQRVQEAILQQVQSAFEGGVLVVEA